LHVHTPASYDWHGGAVTGDDIIVSAEQAGLSVIAITDHHSIAWVDQVSGAANGKELTVLPGIELRTDKGNRGIHLIGIFREGTESKLIYDKVLAPLGFAQNDVKEKGNDQIYCNFENACEMINSLGGMIFLHAGKKQSGIEQLDSDTRSLLKKDIANKVDALEISNSAQKKEYEEKVFANVGRRWPLIVTSDSFDRQKTQYPKGHSLDLIGKKFIWVKADPTFDGLRQIIYEPDLRLSLEERVPAYLYPRIASARLLNNSQYQEDHRKSLFPPITLDAPLFFSPNLTTVIGPRAAGKSVLVEVIGYVIDKYSTESNKDKLALMGFLKENFPDLEIEVTYQVGEEPPTTLSRKVSESGDPFYSAPLKVEYWSQGEIERKAGSPDEIADYIGERLTSNLLVEIEGQIKTAHAEMVSIRDKYTEKLELEIEKGKLESEHKHIDSYFEKLKSPEYRDIVAKIKENRKKQQFIGSLIQDIEAQTGLINELVEHIVMSQTVDKGNVLTLFNEEPQLKAEIEKFYELREPRLSDLAQGLKDIVDKIKASTIKKKLDQDASDLKNQFTEYCRRNGIIVTQEEYKNRNDRVQYIDQRLSKIQSQLREFDSRRQHHRTLADELKEKLGIWVPENKALVQNFNTSFEGSRIQAFWGNPANDLADWIKNQFIESNNRLRSVIDKHFRAKSPVREDYLEEIIQELVATYKEEVVEKIITALLQGKEPDLEASSTKKLTLRWFFEDEATKILREDLVMRLEEYSETGRNYISYSGKTLGKVSMSFGERCGTLVELILLSGDHPLIIDQPEDHLDAKFIADRVVELIRSRKVNRQVIICTHNPNIVVLGDSELVTALFVGADNQVKPFQGSLESFQMRGIIYDVLEGGESAFRKREARYGGFKTH